MPTREEIEAGLAATLFVPDKHAYALVESILLAAEHVRVRAANDASGQKAPLYVIEYELFGPMTRAATRRPKHFEDLPPREQWAIDKKLGILDWDGDPLK